jgi:hypothetical protein
VTSFGDWAEEFMKCSARNYPSISSRFEESNRLFVHKIKCIWINSGICAKRFHVKWFLKMISLYLLDARVKTILRWGKALKKVGLGYRNTKSNWGIFFYQNRKIFVEIARTAMNSGWQ